MEINFNPLKGPEPVRPAQAQNKSAVDRDTGSFDHVSELERALRDLPATRPEKVELGRELVSNVKYPPYEMLDRIANLLALHIQNND
jgi:hypothetical protein